MLHVDIRHGPGLSDILDAFGGCYAKPQKTVLFDPSLSGINYVELRINGMTHESGTPGMLCLDGHFEKVLYTNNKIIPEHHASFDGLTSFEGFYDANTRTGWLEFYLPGEKKS